MNTKSIVVTFIVLLLIIVGFLYFQNTTGVIDEPNNPGQNTATTTDSQVQTSIVARIDQGGSALGVRVIPHEVLEDSRCPINAVCIQAGTVRVRATLESGSPSAEQIFTLGVPVTTETSVVTLTHVAPSSIADNVIPLNQYEFTFEIKERTDTAI